MHKFKIEYCANLLGVDLANPYALDDIAQIQNLDGFIAFVKANLKNARLNFLNNIQRLNELKRMWDEELNAHRLSAAQTASQALCTKVGEVKPALKKELQAGQNPSWGNLYQDGKPCFTLFEIKTLDKIGTQKYVVGLHDSHLLQPKIEQLFRAQVLHMPRLGLSENSRINALLNNTIKTA